MPAITNPRRRSSPLRLGRILPVAVYTARRASTSDAWSTPVNLGGLINTGGNETRSSLSWDGTRLHFGRDGEILVSTRLR